MRQHEQFRQTYVDASDWIRKSKLDMQQFGDSNGDRDALEEKQRKCSELRESFPHGQMLIDKAIDLSQVSFTSIISYSLLHLWTNEIIRTYETFVVVQSSFFSIEILKVLKLNVFLSLR